MSDRGDVRQRIIDAAATLLTEAGRDAVTTRAVSAAAGVQPPTIYRNFGDMSGLLEAVALAGFADYLGRKQAQPLSDDPVQDLRAGWDLHQQYALESPAHYLLMYGQPMPGRPAPASTQALDRLRMLVERVAAAGRLRVAVAVAVGMIHATGVGLALDQIGAEPERRDPEQSVRLREAILAAVTVPASGDSSSATTTVAASTAQRAIALKAQLDAAPDDAADFSAAERALLGEYLERLA